MNILNTQNLLIPRKYYTSGKASHREYYGQFVTESSISWVSSVIGIDRLLKSTDPHLNDISLQTWDRFYFMLNGSIGRKLCAANNSTGYSLSDAVCIAKESARQLMEGAS